MMGYSVKQEGDRHLVVASDGTAHADFATNREAWKRADRLNEDVVSPSEKRSDFAFQQSLKGR